MMVRFVDHSDIDTEKWDSLVLNSSFSSIFLTSEVLGLLTFPDTWHAVVMGDYEAVMPLPTRKKWSFRYAYPPFFIPQSGIISKSIVTEETVKSFLSVIPENYILADIIFNSDCPCVDTNCNLDFVSHTLNLQPSYENLYNNFSTNTKRNIRNAENEKFKLTIDEDIIDETVELFKTNRGLLKNVNFSAEDYERLSKTARFLKAKGMCDIYGVRDMDGKLVAGAFFVKDKDRTWFWFSGRDNSAPGMPMFYLIDSFLKSNAGGGMVLDFNGSTNPNVARLYSGFGGIPYHFSGIRWTRNRMIGAVAKLYQNIKSFGKNGCTKR